MHYRKQVAPQIPYSLTTYNRFIELVLIFWCLEDKFTRSDLSRHKILWVKKEQLWQDNLCRLESGQALLEACIERFFWGTAWL